MTKFKVGDPVRILDEPEADHKIGDVGIIFHDDDIGYCLVDVEDRGRGQYRYSELELIKENYMKYKQGDVLVRGDYEKKVLGVCGEAYLTSNDNLFDTGGGIHTQGELDRLGYTLKTEPETTELTVAEIEQKLGVTKLKIVKERKDGNN